MLRGWATKNGVKVVLVPSFPSSHNSFFQVYSAHADVAHSLWHGIVQMCSTLMAHQLCRGAMSQGTMFCSKCSPPVELDE